VYMLGPLRITPHDIRVSRYFMQKGRGTRSLLSFI
jgi:hypothetical protein